jgi:subtilisin family serine protease
MAKLDPRLRMVLESVRDAPALETAEAEAVPLGSRVGWESSGTTGIGPTMEVLVEGVGLDRLGSAVPASETTSPAPGAAVRPVRVPVSVLQSLADDPLVTRVEAAQPLFAELNVSRPDTRADQVHSATAPFTGEGAIVAVIDSGIDYTHPAFRRGDGSSRVRCLWDQAAPGAGGGDVPFGREFRKADIDGALAAADPLAIVPHADRSPVGHGTHVAGIAAGDERGTGDFTGIAPDAELIVVALDAGGDSLGTSPRLVAALDYVVDRAAGSPVAINLSVGTNGGGHAGDSLVERRINELAVRPGVVIVKSAGNEQQWGIHAGGDLLDGEERRLAFEVRAADRIDDVIEVWFGGDDEIAVGVRPPTGGASPTVQAGGLVRFDTDAGNRVRIEVDDDANGTGDRCATVVLQAGTATELEPGGWQLILVAGAVTSGRFDAWVERTDRSVAGAPEQTRFAGTSIDPTRTVTIPGTARRIVTVGSYVTKSFDGTALGRLSGFSSTGPTRLGLPKPELAAPGEFVMSAHAGFGLDGQRRVSLQGTSMAAPHVTGAAALVLQARPDLTADQVLQILQRSVRADGFVASGPARGWGRGKLDVAAAVALAGPAGFPAMTSVQLRGARISVTTDRPAAVAVRGSRRAARLAMGAPSWTLDAVGEGTEHECDMSGLDPAEYAVEIVATTPDGWWTVDDARGAYHHVAVGEHVEAVEPGPATADDLEQITGVGRVSAQRLIGAGFGSYSGIAVASADQLAAATGRPVERVRQDDWVGQAAQLAAGRPDRAGNGNGSPDPRTRHPFTLVALSDRRSGRLIAWEATDTWTHDRTVVRDSQALIDFLVEKVQ